MDFRSDYSVKGQNLMLNYIPAISQQHPYSLTTMYPYSTQLNGEVGVLAEVTYTFDKSSYFGGKYPVMLNMTYSRVNSLDTSYTKDLRYDSPFFSAGNKLYYQDISLQIEKRWSPDFKSNFYFTNTIYDKDLMENEDLPHYGKVHSTVAVADLSFKLNNKNTLRTELQHEWCTQDSTIKVPDSKNGNWVTLLAEYTIAPTWYFTVYDEYNYGNSDNDHKLHYINGSVTFVHSALRIQAKYGRQNGGILCVGGVCRQVPAATGLSLSISSSFYILKVKIMNNILKYKNQFTAFIAIFVFMAFITSCDIIDEPYREKTTQDTTKTVKRKILLEEFTGFRCKNCPHAAETIHSL